MKKATDRKIERSLIGSNGNSERVKCLKSKLNGGDINVF